METAAAPSAPVVPEPPPDEEIEQATKCISELQTVSLKDR